MQAHELKNEGNAFQFPSNMSKIGSFIEENSFFFHYQTIPLTKPTQSADSAVSNNALTNNSKRYQINLESSRGQDSLTWKVICV